MQTSYKNLLFEEKGLKFEVLCKDHYFCLSVLVRDKAYDQG